MIAGNQNLVGFGTETVQETLRTAPLVTKYIEQHSQRPNKSICAGVQPCKDASIRVIAVGSPRRGGYKCGTVKRFPSSAC